MDESLTDVGYNARRRQLNAEMMLSGVIDTSAMSAARHGDSSYRITKRVAASRDASGRRLAALSTAKKRLRLSQACAAPKCRLPPLLKGLCNTHYLREYRRLREHDLEVPRCADPDCVRALYAKGLCSKHYGASLSRYAKPRLTLRQREQVRERLMAGESRVDVATAFGVSYNTIRRIAVTPKATQ